MRRFLKPALYIVVGILLAFPLFSLAYYTMVRTSTPQFCASCHEIGFAYNTWRTSTHTNNGQGFHGIADHPGKPVIAGILGEVNTGPNSGHKQYCQGEAQ